MTIRPGGTLLTVASALVGVPIPANIPEPDFCGPYDHFRGLALSVSSNRDIIAEVIKPRVFIGSSAEGENVARALGQLLSDIAFVHVWPEAFKLGGLTLDTLNRELARSDYAVLVSTSDDRVRSRGTESAVPRDNVVFEAGLFMGRI